MRLSSLAVAVILLFSSVVFAQHTSTSSAASSPAPSVAASAAPSSAPSSPPASAAPSSPAPAASPSPSAASSAAPSAGVSHYSAPSSPGPVSVPESHAAPTPSSSSGHASGAASSDSSAGKVAPPVRESNSGNGDRIVGSPRIGETPAAKEKEKDDKLPESDLRRRREPQPTPGEADLRRRVCDHGECACPPGQSPGKKGSCGPAAPVNTAATCQPNETWNGSACTMVNRCQAGESWDGGECVNLGQCASYSSRAELQASEARAVRNQMEAACSQDPTGQDCMRLRQSHDGAVQRYRMLMNEAPLRCRTALPDPISL
jgi:hypothetical protein